MARYLCISGEGNWAYSVELERDESYRIGRAADNDIVLKDPRVSSYHARLVNEGENWLVTDLNSRNGTYLNDNRLRRAELKEGDHIAFGSTVMRFVSRLDAESLEGKSVLSPRLSQPLMRSEVQKLHDLIGELKIIEKRLSSGLVRTEEVMQTGKSLGNIAAHLEETETGLRLLGTLNAFHEIFQYAPTPASVYHEVLQFLVSATDAENAAVVLRSKSGVLRVPSTHGLAVSGWPRQIPPRFESLLQDAMEAGRTVHIPSMRNDPHFSGQEGDATGDHRSILIAPVRGGEEGLLGALYFDNPGRPAKLSAKSVDLATRCAEVLGGFLSGAAAQRGDTSRIREAVAERIGTEGSGQQETLC